jgi:hypothetical protein
MDRRTQRSGNSKYRLRLSLSFLMCLDVAVDVTSADLRNGDARGRADRRALTTSPCAPHSIVPRHKRAISAAGRRQSELSNLKNRQKSERLVRSPFGVSLLVEELPHLVDGP